MSRRSGRPAGEEPGRQVARFAIIEAVVGPGCCWASEHFSGVEHVDAAFCEGGGAFIRVAGDPHIVIVPP